MTIPIELRTIALPGMATITATIQGCAADIWDRIACVLSSTGTPSRSVPILADYKVIHDPHDKGDDRNRLDSARQ